VYTKDDGASWQPLELPLDADRPADRDGLALRVGFNWKTFDAGKLAFFSRDAEPLRKPEDIALRVVDGPRGLRLFAAQDSLGAHDVKIEIVGGKKPVKHDLWHDCRSIDAAMHGDVVMATCDDDAQSLLVRSDDGGETFHDVATNATGTPLARASIAVGNGFVWYAPRCAASKCSSPRVLDHAGAWHDAADNGDAIAFANDDKDLYEVAADLSVYKVSEQEATLLAKLPAQTHLVRTRIGADHGIVRVTVDNGDARLAWEVTAGKAQPIDLPKNIRTIVFAGKRGLARDDDGLLETADGKTFYRVSGPSVHDVQNCSAGGCATDRGFRLGWAKKEDAIAKPQPRAYARPFACKPAGEWSEIGRSPAAVDADSVDHGASQWVAGLHAENGAITAFRVGWNGESELVKLLDAAPAGPNDRTQSTVYTQSAGVIARRLSYQHGEGGKRNPVSVSAAWVRNDGSKSEVAPRVVGTFYVPHDPQPLGLISLDDAIERGPYVTWLGPRGLWFHAPTGGLSHFQDDGVVTTYFGDSFDALGSANVVVDGPRVLSLGSSLQIAAPRSDRAIATAPLLYQAGELGLFEGRPVAFWRGKVLAFDLSDAGAIASVNELPSVDARTPGCAPAPGPGAITVPFSLGERHPIVIEGAEHRTYMTGRLRARIANGSACVVAWEASTIKDEIEGPQHSALVFATDPKRSIELSRDSSVWPAKLSMRPLSCEPSDVPFTEEDPPRFKK
jgi:hypothetical protein